MAVSAGLGGDSSSLLCWCQLGQLDWRWKIHFQDGPTPMVVSQGWHLALLLGLLAGTVVPLRITPPHHWLGILMAQ